MKVVSTLIVVSLTVTGIGWWWFSNDECPVPISYRLGELDDRFGLTISDAEAIVTSAAVVWEEATGLNLFTYDASSDLTVDFIYDERQARANSEEVTRSQLDVEQAENEALRSQIESLQTEYESLQAAFESKKATYEADLADYNDTVRQYNDRGGAPSDVHAELEATRAELSITAQSLGDTATKLNAMADTLNKLGNEGNRRIAAYNEEVNDYNAQYGYIGEFTQGDYQGEDIHIYKFSTEDELKRVLVHEFGHALGVDHVEATSAVMYYLMEEPAPTPVLTDADLAAFTAVCGTGTDVRYRLRQWLARWM